MSYGNRVWQAPGEAPSDAAREGGDEGRDGGESRPPPRDAGPAAPGDWDAIMDAFAAMDEDKRAIALRQMDAIARMARSVLEAAPEDRPGVYDAALRQARSMGIPVDNLPPDYDPSLEALLEQHIGVARAFLDRAGGPRKQE